MPSAGTLPDPRHGSNSVPRMCPLLRHSACRESHLMKTAHCMNWLLVVKKKPPGSIPALNNHDGLASINDGMNPPLILRQLLAFQRGRRGRIVHRVLPALLQQNYLVWIAICHRVRNTAHRDGMKFIEEVAKVVPMSGIANPMPHYHQDAGAGMVGTVRVKLSKVGVHIGRVARIEMSQTNTYAQGQEPEQGKNKSDNPPVAWNLASEERNNHGEKCGLSG